jgi:hypothetical protein
MAGDFVDRLNAVEPNPWLAYALCKRCRLAGLGELQALAPGADIATLRAGWLEWEAVRRWQGVRDWAPT